LVLSRFLFLKNTKVPDPSVPFILNKKMIKDLIVQEIIEQKIYLIRGQKVMLDRDLAVLYEITTGNFNKAVSRNLDRFPSNFIF